MTFHIRLSLSAYDQIFGVNLDEETLETRFLAPYREGQAITWEGRSVAPNAIGSVRIFETDQPVPHTDRFNLLVPRSTCPHCGHRITALENIPVLSHLFLGGKCSACKTPIPLRYPIIELFTGLLSALLIWQYGAGPKGFATLAFCYFLIALTFIDVDTQLLPDDLTYPLLWCGLLVNLKGTYVSLPDAVIGAAAGYLSLWSIYWLFKLATGKEGMGYGDFKLLAALGAWFGWAMLPVIILLSSVVGAVIGIALILFTKRGRDKPMPFGPYLAAAGMIALFFGKPLQGMLFGFIA